MQRLTGKTALITGAAGGQGRAGAVLFAREGTNLALCDVDAAGLDETAELVSKEHPDVSVLTRQVDVQSLLELDSFVTAVSDRFPAIDIIYHNAGVNHIGSIDEATEEDWDRVHGINLKSAFFLVKYALPGLRRSTGASVINVSSGAGLLAPSDGNSLYCSSKGGLIALTKAQARDLAPDGIRVNCLLPGPIETPMVRKYFASFPPDEQEIEKEKAVGRSLFKRFGQPEEVASMAVFLATEEASYMTAAIIPVDSGWTAV
jgi:NAD(P)-dependent dehydrogenase (short-subunit alcohol dehydrogenase family)